MSAPVISHVGIAVLDLDAAIQVWSLVLGTKPALVAEVSLQKVKIAMFSGGTADTGGRIELVAPISSESSISRFLSERGDGLHHVCIYVDDIEKRLSELKAAGFRLIDETPRVGAEGHRIAFVHPTGTGGVLLELEERSSKM